MTSGIQMVHHVGCHHHLFTLACQWCTTLVLWLPNNTLTSYHNQLDLLCMWFQRCAHPHSICIVLILSFADVLRRRNCMWSLLKPVHSSQSCTCAGGCYDCQTTACMRITYSSFIPSNRWLIEQAEAQLPRSGLPSQLQLKLLNTSQNGLHARSNS